MNYERIYSQIIERAKNRILDGYVEIHHIIPRCIGGTDQSTNLVNLTAREHFIAHWLLSRIHPTNIKLAYAFRSMAFGYNSPTHGGNRYICSSRTYKEAKERIHILGLTDEHKKNISIARKGFIVSDVTKQKLRDANLGKRYTRSDEYKAKLSDSHKGKKHEMTPNRLAYYESMRGKPTGRVPWNKGKSLPDEVKQKIKNTLSKQVNPMKHTDTVNKMRESRRRNKEEQIKNGTYIPPVPWNKGKKIQN
jgi:hypothetical protein